MATAIQNIGLVFAPTAVGYIKDQTKSVDYGFFYMNSFFILINIFGLVMNMGLYYIDIYRNNGVLDKPDDSEVEELPQINETRPVMAVEAGKKAN